MIIKQIKAALMAATVTLVVLVSCDGSGTTTVVTSTAGDDATTPGVTADAASSMASASGDFSCSIDGAISHDTWDASQRSEVTFARFPASLGEFETAFGKLASEPQGVVALQVMAFELYRHDAGAGEKALRMINTDVNCTQTLRQLKEMMNTSDAYYSRPYLAWALLKGSTPENGYTPTEPYAVQVRVNPSAKYQESEFLSGTVIYLQVQSKGWDTEMRGVEVVKPEGSSTYVVSNCPALYTQCKKVKGSWNR